MPTADAGSLPSGRPLGEWHQTCGHFPGTASRQFGMDSAPKVLAPCRGHRDAEGLSCSTGTASPSGWPAPSHGTQNHRRYVPAMTGTHGHESISRRKALAVTGGTVAAGGLAAVGYQSAFAETATGTKASTAATASVSASSAGSTCVRLMSSVTEGPYHLDGALVRKDAASSASPSS